MMKPHMDLVACKRCESGLISKTKREVFFLRKKHKL